MTAKQFFLSVFLIACFIAACKTSTKKEEEKPTPDVLTKTNPCDSPKTVKELLACAKTVGTVKKDSIQVKLGSDFNQGCGTAWNPNDTVLVISYVDSISLWRVNEKKNVPGKYQGHWFTNFSAKDSGYTKEETLHRFALNPCPIDSLSWTNCTCTPKKQNVDSVIRYEVQAKLGPNQQLRFGIVGKSPFGDGGEMQWHMTSRRKPPYRQLQEIRWE